jgi:hypothetical protein
MPMLGWMTATLAAALLAQAAPSDWYHVDSAHDHANASFIDKANIHANASGNLEASLFSLLATPDEGVSAYRFTVEFDCKAQRSRLIGAESFDARHQSDGGEAVPGEWGISAKDTQGGTIAAFVCSRGASQPDKKSLGSALPWETGRAFF